MVSDHIIIGSVSSVGHPDEWSLIPDDRQTLVPIIGGGVTVEDYGRCVNGDRYSATATFSSTDYNTLVSYWNNRTLVNVIEEDGTVHSNCRIVIKSVRYPRLIPQYKIVQFEVWAV